MTRSAAPGQSHTIFSRLRTPPALDTTMPLVRSPAVRRGGGAPSSTSRASPAVTGASCAAAASTTRCTTPVGQIIDQRRLQRQALLRQQALEHAAAQLFVRLRDLRHQPTLEPGDDALL